MSQIHPKVAASTTVSTVIGALVTILAAANVIVPDSVSTAAVAVISGVIVIAQFVGGYLKSA